MARGDETLSTTNQAHNISISIERDLDEVYEITSRPENFPRWATGLATALEPEGDHWVAQSPDGPIEVRWLPHQRKPGSQYRRGRRNTGSAGAGCGRSSIRR